MKQFYSSLVPQIFVAVTGLVSEPDPGTVQEGKCFEAIIVVLHPVVFVSQGCCQQMMNIRIIVDNQEAVCVRQGSCPAWQASSTLG